MTAPSQKILSSILFLMISIATHAQGSPGGGEGPPAPNGGGTLPPGTPIDDGLLVLGAIAVIYGIYRIMKHSKKPA